MKSFATFCLFLLTASLAAQDSLPNLNKDFILGKFDYRKHKDFVKVDSAFCNKDIYLQKAVYESYQKMYKSALKSGIRLTLISGTRNFDEQKWIWERKWNAYEDLKPKDRALKILEYSSMPTTSRHHWGTDIDLVSLNNNFFKTPYGKKVYAWLKSYAHKFGFYLVYTNKTNGRNGYNEEKWHWTYLPLSKLYLDYYNKQITYKNIQGFSGSELASKLMILEKYVNGVSEELKYN